MLKLAWFAYNAYVVTLNYRIMTQIGFSVGVGARFWVDALIQAVIA